MKIDVIEIVIIIIIMQLFRVYLCQLPVQGYVMFSCPCA